MIYHVRSGYVPTFLNSDILLPNKNTKWYFEPCRYQILRTLGEKKFRSADVEVRTMTECTRQKKL